MRLFKRKYRLQVDTVVIADTLDIDFRLQRSLQPKPNTAEITVYNLSPEHRAQLTSNKNSYVTLDAGYEDGISRLFSGDTRKVEHEHNDKDWVTRITAGDGERAFQTRRVSQSFGPDASVETVIRTVAEAMGVGIGNAVEALRGASLLRVGRVFPNGTVIHGQADREMKALAASCGLEWSVQDGVMCITRRGGVQSTETIVLSPDTGLLGVPTVGKKNVVKAKCLLIPGLIPGRLVEFRGTTGAVGIYRVYRAEYSGQSWGGDWEIEIECQRFDLVAA